MVSWGFLKDGAGILPASNMADPLRGANLKPTDILVREAVQNSLDERRPDAEEPVRVRFTRLELSGAGKSRFVDGLRLRTLADRRRYFSRSQRNFGADVFDPLGDPQVPLPILIISDFNANGLGGRWRRRGSRDDRFFNLVLSIGGSRKQSEDEADDSINALGSYGYGKMAFAMSSPIRTVLYYSTFCSTPATEGVRARAMASSFLPEHTAGKEAIDYAGQAYLGTESSPSDERIPREPLSNGDAHGWIQELGIPVRADADTGTTVVIPGAPASLREVALCCETWWWPRMRDPDTSRRVLFEFADGEGSRITCDPRSHHGLGPFLDCHRIVIDGHADDRHALRPVRVLPRGQRRLAGRLALRALPEDVSESGTLEGENTSETPTGVALIRDGLVIRYDPSLAHEDKPPVAGVFVPDPDPETLRAFALSEPPAHDDWVENSGRLQDRFAWGTEFLRLTKKRLRTLTRDYQVQLASQPTVERTPASSFLRKLLTPLLRPQRNGRGAVPPPPSVRAFSISRVRTTRRKNGREQHGIFRVALSEHAGVPSAQATISISLLVLADANATPGSSVPCTAWVSGRSRETGDPATFPVELHDGQALELEATAPVYPHWRVQWRIGVEKAPE